MMTVLITMAPLDVVTHGKTISMQTKGSKAVTNDGHGGDIKQAEQQHVSTALATLKMSSE